VPGNLFESFGGKQTFSLDSRPKVGAPLNSARIASAMPFISRQVMPRPEDIYLLSGDVPCPSSQSASGHVPAVACSFACVPSRTHGTWAWLSNSRKERGRGRQNRISRHQTPWGRPPIMTFLQEQVERSWSPTCTAHVADRAVLVCTTHPLTDGKEKEGGTFSPAPDFIIPVRSA
jgi:hypothetical protein